MGHFGAGKQKKELRGEGEKVCSWPKLWNDRGDGGRRRRRRLQAPWCKSESDGQREKKEECSGVRRDRKKDRIGGRFRVNGALQF